MSNDARTLVPPMAWNAWGDPAAAKPLSDGIRTLLEQALGVTVSEVPAPSIAEVQVRPSGLADVHRDALAAIRGCRLHPDRRPGPAVVRRRQVHAGSVAPQANPPGRAGCGVAPRQRGRDRDRTALLLAARHRRGAVRWRHQRGRRTRPDPRRLRRRHLTGPAPARRAALARRDVDAGRTGRGRHRTRRRAAAG